MDNLLEKFKKFEVEQSFLKKLTGGSVVLTGCRQDGGNSYIDYSHNGTQFCESFVGSDDDAGWFDRVSGLVGSQL